MFNRRCDSERAIRAGRDVRNYRYDEKGMMDFQHPLFYFSPVIGLPARMKEDFCKNYCRDTAI
jgi:hypothetical protein